MGFSEVCLGITFAFVALTGMIVVVGSNLPTFEELENYSPPTISRSFLPKENLLMNLPRNEGCIARTRKYLIWSFMLLFLPKTNISFNTKVLIHWE